MFQGDDGEYGGSSAAADSGGNVDRNANFAVPRMTPSPPLNYAESDEVVAQSLNDLDNQVMYHGRPSSDESEDDINLDQCLNWCFTDSK
eukprot:scaffold257_cov85-Skeletonema_dohrnii-CCMP3373.AAC.5